MVRSVLAALAAAVMFASLSTPAPVQAQPQIQIPPEPFVPTVGLSEARVRAMFPDAVWAPGPFAGTNTATLGNREVIGIRWARTRFFFENGGLSAIYFFYEGNVAAVADEMTRRNGAPSDSGGGGYVYLTYPGTAEWAISLGGSNGVYTLAFRARRQP